MDGGRQFLLVERLTSSIPCGALNEPIMYINHEPLFIIINFVTTEGWASFPTSADRRVK